MKLFPRFKIGIIIVLLITFFAVLNLTGFSKEIKNFFYLISSPIQKTFWRAGDSVSDFFEAISRAENLKEENEKLELRIQELTAEVVMLKELKRENKFLREALNIGLEKEFQLQLAQIINKDSFQDSILINKGRRDGLKQGLPVITHQGALLGRIGEVFQNFSEVILISNKKSSFDAKISEREIYGVIKGGGRLRASFDLILREEEIFEGEVVVTSSLGGIFPQGLLVGEIKEIRKSDIEPFQTAEIEPSFDIKKIDNLFIIIDD